MYSKWRNSDEFNLHRPHQEILSILCSTVGILVAIVITLVTLRLCDYVTTVKEWDLIKSGNEAAGLFFIGAGLIVFTVLLAAAWFPRM